MKKQIVHVSVMQTAKVFAVLYFVISIPLVLLMAIPAMLTPGGMPGMPLLMLILMPVLYLVIGFLTTLFGAWIYNLVAGRIGGIEFTTAEVSGE